MALGERMVFEVWHLPLLPRERSMGMNSYGLRVRKEIKMRECLCASSRAAKGAIQDGG